MMPVGNNIQIGEHSKISISIPLKVIPESFKSIDEKIKCFVYSCFEKLFYCFVEYPYSIFLGTHKIQSIHSNNHSYRLFYHLNLKDLQKNPYVILALDGGGVRGKVSLGALKVIEKEIKANIVKAVDCVAGVSTGGIITAALSAPSLENPKEPRYSALDVDLLYDQFAKEVFSNSLLYRLRSIWGSINSKYENPRPILEKIIGDEKLSNSVVSKLIITSFDVLSGKSVLFENKGQKSKEILKKANIDCLIAPQDTSTCDAILSTSAAPTYFPSMELNKLNLIDGAIATNSPAQLATLIALSEEAKGRPLLVIRIGTGRLPTEPITRNDPLHWGWIQWAQPLINYLIEANSNLSIDQMKLLTMINANVNFIDFQVTLKNEAEEALDNADPQNLRALGKLGKHGMLDYINSKGGREHLINPLKQKLMKK
jgi:predicted acylesterase/phospholipase RssA